MKGFIVFFSFCFLSGLLLSACQRNRGVEASSDEYKPRPAPSIEVPKNHEIKGELLRIDRDDKRVIVRVVNGMVQTFKFNDCTEVEGLQNQPQTKERKNGATQGVNSLIGKEGSEVAVQWAEAKGARLALVVQVTQVSTAKNTRRFGQRPY